ncbi:hypothetical protein TNCV_4567381 [Trichonephila clavipes]|nr:hypothetical protein TNCV_4567381 [Trichonephila clavipes]
MIRAAAVAKAQTRDLLIINSSPKKEGLVKPAVTHTLTLCRSYESEMSSLSLDRGSKGRVPLPRVVLDRGDNLIESP